MTDRTDNFNRADGGLGANWTLTTDSFVTVSAQITSNKARNTGTPPTDSLQFWGADSFQNDQYAEIVITLATAGSAGACTRCAKPGGVLKGYIGDGATDTLVYFYNYDGGSVNGFNFIGSTFAGVASGDTIRLESTGTTQVIKVNGVAKHTVTDATYSAGAPGFHLFPDTSGTADGDDWLGGPIVSGSGVGAAAGTGTAAGVGAATAASVAAATGTGTATGVGAATAASVAAATGSGTATGVGAATAASVAAATGSGTATGVGAATAASVAAATGTGTATGVGASVAAAVGAASGTGTATGVGASTAASVGAAAGTGDAPAVGADAGAAGAVGAASGTGTATGVGASTAASVGAAAGTGDAPGVGASTAASVGAAAGTGDAPGVGRDASTPATSGYAMALGGEDSFYEWWRRQKRAIERPASAAKEVDRVEPSPIARDAISSVPAAILKKVDKAATSYDVRVIASGLDRVEAVILEALARAADEEAAGEQEEEDVANVFLSLI